MLTTDSNISKHTHNHQSKGPSTGKQRMLGNVYDRQEVKGLNVKGQMVSKIPFS